VAVAGICALLGAALTGASLASTTTCTTSGASLSGSTFEGADGNMIVNGTNCTDWANVTGLNQKADQSSGSGDNAFGQGTKENDPAVTVVDGSIPPQKSDLLDFYEASEYAAGHNLLYLGWDRSNQLGNANMDFEINQKVTNTNEPCGGASPQPACIPFSGSTTGKVSLNRTAGDLLVTYDFGGSGTPGIGLDIWTTGPTSANATASTDCKVYDGSQDKVVSNGNSYPCWGQGKSLTALNEAVAGINSTTITNPLTGTLAGSSLIANTFGETAVDLTAAGVFQAGQCKAFGSAFLKSRSSTSFTSEVKDFVAPQPVNISNCGTINITKTAQNGNNTFSYTGASTTGATLPTGFDSFSLTTVSGTATTQFTNVPPGGFTVTEGIEPTDWTFVSLVCSATGSGTSASQDGTVSTQGDITMAPGGVANCTYTNKTKLSPGISTQIKTSAGANTSSVVVGSTVHDTATLTGSFTSNAGGTVAYTVYTNNSCTTAAVGGTDINAQPTPDAGVTAGVVGNSADVTFLKAGSYWFQAVYSGDGNNNGATSTCTSEPITITQAPTGETTAQTIVPDDSFTLTGGNSPTGTITFKLFGPSNTTCSSAAGAAAPVFTQTITNVNGAGTYSTTNRTSATPVTVTTAGEYRWLDVYSGDGNNQGVTSACGVEKITNVGGS
jgi:hypothetical protein